jgi:type I restriction enzyme R subunit
MGNLPQEDDVRTALNDGLFRLIRLEPENDAVLTDCVLTWAIEFYCMNKKSLSERDICTKFISPAVQRAGWDMQSQVREEVHFTKGRINVRGKMVSRGKDKFADYILYYKPNIPIALIEAKNNNLPIGGGMQQGLGYAETLDIPFVFSSNGDGFVLHDRTGQSDDTEVELKLDEFPSPDALWARYRT